MDKTMDVEATFRLSRRVVADLNKFSQLHLDMNDFASLVKDKPRKALALLVAYTQALASGKGAGFRSTSPQGFVTVSNDPEIIQKYIRELPEEYKDKTVRVTLVITRRFWLSRTVVFTAPPSDS
jgi:hypothetical protein